MKDDAKSVWIITHSFPPNAEVGGLRSLGLCQYLAEQDWQVTVICADPKDSRCDEALMKKIPASIKTIRTKWVDLPAMFTLIVNIFRSKKSKRNTSKIATGDIRINHKAKDQSKFRTWVDWISLWLYVPDGRSGWFFSSVVFGLYAGLIKRPTVIFASGPSWTGLLSGCCLSYIFKTPFVADFRDPWLGSAFHDWRRRFKAHRIVHGNLEQWVVKRASRITCAWDGIRKSLLERYPEKKNIKTIVNGFDQSDFKDIHPIIMDKSRCVFIHAGGFYGPRSPEPLLSAIKLMSDNNISEIEKALFVFIGNPEYHGRSLADICNEYGVSKYIKIIPSVPQTEVFKYLKGADIAMLFGQSGSESLASIPAKTFEYIGLKKPVIAVGAGDEVCSVLKEGGCPLWRVNPLEINSMAMSLKNILQVFIAGKLPQVSSGTEKFARYRMAQKIESILFETIE